MINGWEYLGGQHAYITGSRINQDTMITSVDQETGIRRSDLIERKVVLPEDSLNLCYWHIGKEALEWIVEGTITQRNTFKGADVKAVTSRAHNNLLFDQYIVRQSLHALSAAIVTC
jgi:hypothetical protein